VLSPHDLISERQALNPKRVKGEINADSGVSA